MANSHVVRFDLQKPPIRQRWYLRLVTWLASYPDIWVRRLKIRRTGVADLKPPYLLLCTHHAFIDFKVTTAAIFPHRANYVVAIDGFIGREWLLRNTGGICKRKFTHDLTMIRHMKRVIDNGDILVLYPEARYSLAGTTAILPDSLGKVARFLGAPVAMLNMHGNYLSSPCWNLSKRKLPLEADFSKILTAEEVRKLPVAEINERIRAAFVYDEYIWQRDNGIRIDHPENAKGLHKVLYQCPACRVEHKMASAGVRLWCENCRKSWTLSEFGELHAENGETEFSHVPDWYEFQRAEVRRQIDNGTYFIHDEVDIDSLPNARGFIHLGTGRLKHNQNGFTLEADLPTGPLQLHKTPASMYSCHIEYDYHHRGDCVELSTLEDTYYIYPKNIENVVTKIALATEELYAWNQSQ